MSLELSVTGDAVINGPVSSCTDDGFLDLIEKIRDADVSYTHLETTLHEYDEPEVIPAATAGGTWMRGPKSVAADLDWAGFNLVSHASNHTLDFSYGGLHETLETLDEHGVAYAGTGENLGVASEPTYVNTDCGRVGLVSMSPSCSAWAAAGHARPDMRGRPGVNALRTYFEVDEDRYEQIRALSQELGYVVMEKDGDDSDKGCGSTLIVQTTYSKNEQTRYVQRDDVSGARRVIDDRDRERNLRQIRGSAETADVTIAHIHSHDFEPNGSRSRPPAFLEIFAKRCVDAGADVVAVQGSHAPVRGLEVYEGALICYDPGDFVIMVDEVTRQPSDFYYDHEERLADHPMEASLADAIQARGEIKPWRDRESKRDRRTLSPEGDSFAVPGSVLLRCSFDETHSIAELRLHPFTWIDEPESLTGIPRSATGDRATEILTRVQELSAEYGTDVELNDGIGSVGIR
ncbi:CapA family protein [Halostagnicola sp. A-GB9-2]|uniref:CapA family protein n=1 Tax=Halostagnicola sp. A-GB9-2 TaxID=3048066 RepID=UPI0024C04664|nr:CapA family protein [Halostagnicola sp. A-GB9-2]MDJ1433815.1 CapA family protein [Halostagnicola sp. A-GB9-2]